MALLMVAACTLQALPVSALICGVNLLKSLPPRSVLVVTGDYIISTPGTVLSDTEIQISNGSVVVAAEDVTLSNVHIKGGSGHTRDGIVVIGFDRCRMRNVLVERVGGRGVVLQDSSGHEMAECLIRQCGDAAIALDHVSYCDLIGVTMQINGTGMDLRNGSHHNRILGCFARSFSLEPVSERFGYRISADSFSNQVVRTRTRDGDGYFVSENADNLWHHSECWRTVGSCGCYHPQMSPPPPKNWGDPAAYSPRSWTVCDVQSFAGESCDFGDLSAAIAHAAPGDVVIFDPKMQGSKTWPAVTVDKPLWLIGEFRGVKGTYGCDIYVGGLTVSSPGVRLQNFKLKEGSPISIVKGTEVINVEVQQGQIWKLIDPATFVDPPNSADLRIAKSATPGTVAVGGDLTYILAVSNSGPATAASVLVMDYLPAGFTVASAPGCQIIGQLVLCDLGDLGPGALRELHIAGQATGPGTLLNLARVRSVTEDIDLLNNESSVSTEVQPAGSPQADLRVVKTGSPNPVQVGGTLTYTLIVSNAGPAAATGVILTDTLPDAVTPTALSPGCTHDGGTVTCSVPDLGPGDHALLACETTVNAAGVLDNVASVAGNEIDPAPENNTSVAVTLAQDASTAVRLAVSDDADDEIYLYNSSGALEGNFALQAAGRPYGVAQHAGEIHVVDFNDKRMSRYSISGNLLAISRTLLTATATGLSAPHGLAIDGDALWLVDKGRRSLYRYSLAAAFAGSGTLNSLQEIPLDVSTPPANNAAMGLALDDTYLYVLDSADRVFFRYSRNGPGGAGSAVVSRSLRKTDGTPLLAANGATRVDGSLWIVDDRNRLALEYPLAGLFTGAAPLPAVSQFSLDADNADAQGM